MLSVAKINMYIFQPVSGNKNLPRGGGVLAEILP